MGFISQGYIHSGDQMQYFIRSLHSHFDTRWHCFQTFLQTTAFPPLSVLEAVVVSNYFLILPPISSFQNFTPKNPYIISVTPLHIIPTDNTFSLILGGDCFPDWIVTDHSILYEDKILMEDDSNSFEVWPAPCPYTVHTLGPLDKNRQVIWLE